MENAYQVGEVFVGQAGVVTTHPPWVLRLRLCGLRRFLLHGRTSISKGTKAGLAKVSATGSEAPRIATCSRVWPDNHTIASRQVRSGKWDSPAEGRSSFIYNIRPCKRKQLLCFQCWRITSLNTGPGLLRLHLGQGRKYKCGLDNRRGRPFKQIARFGGRSEGTLGREDVSLIKADDLDTRQQPAQTGPLAQRPRDTVVILSGDCDPSGKGVWMMMKKRKTIKRALRPLK